MVNTRPGMVFSIRIHFVLHNPVWTDSYELRSSWAVFLNIPSHKIEISTCQFRLPADKFTKFRLEHAFINNVLNLRHVHRPAVAPRLTQHVKVRTKAGYHFGLHKILAYDIQWLPLIVPKNRITTSQRTQSLEPTAIFPLKKLVISKRPSSAVEVIKDD